MWGIPQPFFVAFIVLFYYISVGGGGDYPQRVTGVIGETIKLVFPQNFTHFAKEIVFKFNRGSKTFKIAAFEDKKLQTEHLQFQNRLEILKDGMGLCIKNVSFNDSGMYIVEITLESNTVHKESFNLSLYEPVPAPSIRIDDEIDTSDGCNFTLHCYVRGNTTSLSYTWKYRDNSSDNFKLYNSTGPTIQMSLQPGSLDREVLCTVRNPADQKNVSHTLKSCQGKETHQNRLRWPLALPVVFVLLLSAIVIIWCKKEKNRAVFQTCNEEPKLSVPETETDTTTKPLQEIFVDIDPKDDVPFSVPEKTVKYSEGFIALHEKKDDKIELGDSEHPSIFPDPEDSENEEEC